MATIRSSIGRSGVNARGDVRTVQELLNRHRLPPLAQLAVDDRIGPKTIAAIEEFQRRVVRMGTPDGRVDVGGRTWQSLTAESNTKKQIGVAIHGWQGKEPTRGFELCANTVAGELAGCQVRLAATKEAFLDLCKELKESGEITQFHLYCHSGMDGPIFVGNKQFMPAELKAGVLPVMNWAKDARVCFYGCNAGLAPWSGIFAATQGVTVRGSAGFSLFSQRRNEFYPFDGDPDRTPCYLDCFPGMNDLLVQKYGYSRPDNFLEGLWRKVKTFPAWREARNTHHPPRPMKIIPPG